MRGLTNRCGDREKQRMACLNRNGRNQATARANIVTCPESTSAWVRGPHTGTTEGLILLAGHLPPNGQGPP